MLRLAWCQPSRSNIGFSLDDLTFVEKLAENRFGFIALQTLAEEFQLLMHLVLYPALVWPHKLSGELQRLRWLGSQGFGLFQRIREEFCRTQHAVDEFEIQRRFGIETLTQQQQLRGLLIADQFR